MPYLLVLYDTSFLMNSRSHVITPQFILPEGYMLIRAIATEVKAELRSHFGDERKDAAARAGRGFVAKIMSEPGYKEVSLRDVPISDTLESLLGPDSAVDKKLIGFALKFLDEDHENLAFIATQDGGIETEAARLMREGKKHIYTPVSEEVLRKILIEKQSAKTRKFGCGLMISALPLIFILGFLGLVESMSWIAFIPFMIGGAILLLEQYKISTRQH